MKILKIGLIPLVILSAAALAAVVNEETISVPVSSGDPVEVFNINGDLSIEEWDSDRVELTYRKTADTEEELQAVIVRCDTDNGLFCEVEYDEELWEDAFSGRVDFILKTPADMELDYHFALVNGDLIMTGSRGYAELELVNGDLTLADFGGDANVHIVNGMANISGTPGAELVEMVSGEIIYAIDEMTNSVDLSSVSGKVYVKLMSDAMVDVSTISGSIMVDDVFSAVIDEQIAGRSTEFGDGPYVIQIETVSGDIEIDD